MNKKNKLLNEIASLILHKLNEDVDGSTYHNYYSTIKTIYNTHPAFNAEVRRYLTDYFNDLPEPKPLYIRDIKDVFGDMARYCQKNEIPLEEVKNRVFEILDKVAIKY